MANITLFAVEDEKLITVGSSSINLKDIILNRRKKFFEDISHDKKITGNLEFCTSVGAEPEFTEECRMKKYSLKYNPKPEENLHLRKINSHNALFNTNP